MWFEGRMFDEVFGWGEVNPNVVATCLVGTYVGRKGGQLGGGNDANIEVGRKNEASRVLALLVKPKTEPSDLGSRSGDQVPCEFTGVSYHACL